jgi:hypothetical protein
MLVAALYDAADAIVGVVDSEGSQVAVASIFRIGRSVSWEFSSKYLTSHGHFSPQLGEKPWSINVRQMPLNQRVQGSSPCAPTNKTWIINDLI